MPNRYDVRIFFDFPPFKLVFTELFLKKIAAPLKTRLGIANSSKKNIYKDLVYSSRWVSIILYESYFENRFWKRNHLEFSNLFFKFWEYLFEMFSKIETKFLIKIVFKSKNHHKLYFLFEKVNSFDEFKVNFSEAIKKIQEYRSSETKVISEIKKAFKLKSKEIYFEMKDKKWGILNLLFNAGKYHHDSFAKNIYDTRVSKPDIIINKEYLNNKLSYRSLWQLNIDNKKYVRIKPNDIALYSSISMSNLKKAKLIYNDKDSNLWKFIQMNEDERELMDYYELIITSIILAYSAVEALINIAIPNNYIHKKIERSKQNTKPITKKFSKFEIERWYTLDDKMNIILPEALDIPLPNQEKWWVKFNKLEKLRNKIIHAVESKSNERYSDILKKDIFGIIESHIQVIKFFGKWATDNKHYLLNELPYGFGYDDIKPKLINNKYYHELGREQRGIK